MEKLNSQSMKLKLIRKYKGSEYTIGDLYINGRWFCNTLEDVVRNLPDKCPKTPCQCKEKVYGKTAIPSGTYKVILSYSNKFKKILPELLNVPHFTGIRIHSGNTADDSLGCILVGYNKVKGKVINSRDAYNKLYNLIKDSNNIIIEIE